MLLALDTSTEKIGLALFDGIQVIAEFQWRSQRRHTAELAPAIFEMLTRTDVSLDEIEAVGVALGPGSFTSLRVGMALAKGLALARHFPLIGIPTLDVVAAAQRISRMPLAAVLQAGRGRLAVGWYKVSRKLWQAEGPAQVMDIEALAQKIQTPTIICGDLTAEERQRLARKHKNVILSEPVESQRRPALLAALAWKNWQNGLVDTLESLSPIYLHSSGDASL